jgi:antitoxin ParD1/3/4
MSIELKPEQQQFIQQQIALGRFGSEEEVLEKALQLLSSQYLEYDNWVADTRAKIDEAQQEIDRGEGIPLDIAMAQLWKITICNASSVNMEPPIPVTSPSP